MAESNDRVILVKKNDYQLELEEQVKYYMELVKYNGHLPEQKNYKLYTRNKVESFQNQRDQHKWELEEISRCKYGHDGMTGKMYFWFNYCYIQNIKGGKIPPEYRVDDDRWFSAVNDAYESDEWGLICVKRRRAGFSWKEAADVLHDVLFTPFFHVGMNSKTERDSVILFKKVLFIYDNLPQFLRASIGSRTSMKLEFFIKDRDDNGNMIKKGTQSSILCVPPTDTAYEGQMLNKWVCDEAGKIPNLPQIWSYTEDCLMQETVRAGLPILFGTSGEVGREGAGLKNMWQNSEIHKLRRFFFGGWMAILIDEFGNSIEEEAIRWIIYERNRRRNLNPKEYTDFIQRYPLTVDEAFSQASSGGLGNIVKINEQLGSLRENPVKAVRGKFVGDLDTKDVEFKPDPLGKCIVYEHPEENIKNLYLAGADPADHDDAYDEASDLSMFIMKKRDGTTPPKIVFEFTDRPKKLDEYFEQAVMALIYYGQAQILIEKNRYRMIEVLDRWGFKYLLKAPPTLNRLIPQKTMSLGVHMNADMKEYLESLVEKYIEDYCEYVPSIELLQECIEYGSKNTDKVMGWGICLINMADDKQRRVTYKQKQKTLPSHAYRKINGKIVRVVREGSQKNPNEDIKKWIIR